MFGCKTYLGRTKYGGVKNVIFGVIVSKPVYIWDTLFAKNLDFKPFILSRKVYAN